MTENVVCFGPGRSLTGIVTVPASRFSTGTAFILLNAGITHRVGPNRLYVKLARSIADVGVYVLRFDFSGIGDSRQSSEHSPFLARASAEVCSAMDSLTEAFGVSDFVVAGICSGAEVAYATTARDHRVKAAVLINGGLNSLFHPNHSEEIQTRIQSRYYFKKVSQLRNWIRILSGKSNYRRIWSSLFHKLRNSTCPANQPNANNLAALELGQVRYLIIVSEGSEAWDRIAILEAAGTFNSGFEHSVRLELIRDCDHVFTPVWSQNKLIQVVTEWAGTFRLESPCALP